MPAPTFMRAAPASGAVVAGRVDPDPVVVGLLPQSEQAGEPEQPEKAPVPAVAVVVIPAVAYAGGIRRIGRGAVHSVAAVAVAKRSVVPLDSFVGQGTGL